MAGESPDRSKQHGSSPEATSGNGAPVPGSVKAGRDPRLVMGGEEARADQATTVLSTRVQNGGLVDTAVKEAEEPTTSEASEALAASEASGGGGARLEAGEAEGAGAEDAVETPKGEVTAESGEEAEGEAEKGGEEASKAEDVPGPPVDQPTTVFKVPRKPAGDQPTTMLKLGGAESSGKLTAPRTDKSDKEGKVDRVGKVEEAHKIDEPAAKAPAESEAERASRFVPLKSLDDPQAAPDAAGAPAQARPERTAQQPLPPKPPLDLLAELTNTPPPPDTPVRTLLRRIKIWTPLVVLLVIVFAIVQEVRPLPTPTLALTAGKTYTFVGGRLDLPWPGQGQSAVEVEGVGMVGTEGAQTPKPIASVTKIMTAYVVLQQHPLKGDDGGPAITADQQAEDESKNVDESTAALKKGQKFTERQMLQMLMIPSGNNVARLLARWDSGNKTFVGKMNAAAEKLGMTHTTYTDPSGLERTTVSTAVDQLKLAKAVMQNEVFRSVVAMAKADVPGLDKPIYNNNDLLVRQAGVIGLKTGSSTPAGGDLVWAATKVIDGRTWTVYGAVLNQDAHTGRVWDSLQLALNNSQKLIGGIQRSLTAATVAKKGEVVGYVDDRFGGKTPVVATGNLTAVGWPGLSMKLSIDDSGTGLPHEAKAGKVIGKLTAGDGSSHAVSVPVALQKDLAEPGYGAKFTRLG